MYLVFKALHVLAGAIFLGNIITGLFWKSRADRSRDPRMIRDAMDGIIASDRVFTIPGVIAVTVFGFGAAGMGELPLLHTGWILWSIILFTVSGVAFMAQLVPLQRRMAAVARAAAEGATMDWAAYDSLTARWNVWGAIALIAPLLALFLMVLKPVLPGL